MNTLSQIKIVEKVNVNVLAEKIQVRLNTKDYSSILNKLLEINFPVLSAPMEINFNSDQNIRSVYFKVEHPKDQEKIKNKFENFVGIHDISVSN